MLDVSSKGTVPVLVMDDSTVIAESLDIMAWALDQNDPDNWGKHHLTSSLIERAHEYFVDYLNRYKYFDRFPEHSQDYYLEKAMVYIYELEDILTSNEPDEHGQRYLAGRSLSALDIALMPFIRQFAFVDKVRFDDMSIPNLQHWLKHQLESNLFNSVMLKYSPWKPEDQVILFGLENKIVHDTQIKEFYIEFEDQQKASVKYEMLQDSHINFYSTFTPVNQRGKNVASSLVAKALQWARENDFKLSASCWYVAKKAVISS